MQIVHEEIGLADTAESLVKDTKKLFNDYAKTRPKEQGRSSQPHVLTLEEVKRAIKEQDELEPSQILSQGFLSSPPQNAKVLLTNSTPLNAATCHPVLE